MVTSVHIFAVFQNLYGGLQIDLSYKIEQNSIQFQIQFHDQINFNQDEKKTIALFASNGVFLIYSRQTSTLWLKLGVRFCHKFLYLKRISKTNN